jgi:hypothetical protein
MSGIRSWEDVIVYIGREYAGALDDLVFGDDDRRS